MRNVCAALLVSSAVLAVLALAPREARADVQVGAGVGLAVPMSKDGYDPGLAVDGRLGYELSLGPIALTPEVTGGFTRIAVDTSTYPGVDAAKIVRGMVGARLGFGKMLVPFVAAHAGYGWLSQGYTFAGSAQTYHDSGFTMDAKLGFDLRPIDLVSVGVNVGYNFISLSQMELVAQGSSLHTYGVGGAINFLSFGLQAALTF